ncbi:hypothetical protein HAX54_018586 [Datura stramonium]|uniref:Uncharacterized protein n=1 Tax=Datura stramonium TaxID=4076 RepID=A0ABS8S1C9_DATST|nr:hypothetical protein [Datura stramonium]
MAQKEITSFLMNFPWLMEQALSATELIPFPIRDVLFVLLKQLMHEVVMEKLQMEKGMIFQITDKSSEEVEDEKSLAWNKGNVYYSHAKEKVIRQYMKQHEEDMNSFLNARAQEVVPGGLVFITVPARPDGTLILKDLQYGDIEEEEVDSFNIPVYITSPSEVKEAIIRNGSFSIEKLEILPKETSPTNGLTAKDASVHIRAITEGLIEEKIGPKILDKLFQLYVQKLEDAYLDLLSGEAISLFVALKRKTNL